MTGEVNGRERIALARIRCYNRRTREGVMTRGSLDFPIGDHLPGTKYVVVRKLGQGGMGAVF